MVFKFEKKVVFFDFSNIFYCFLQFFIIFTVLLQLAPSILELLHLQQRLLLLFFFFFSGLSFFSSFLPFNICFLFFPLILYHFATFSAANFFTFSPMFFFSFFSSRALYTKLLHNLFCFLFPSIFISVVVSLLKSAEERSSGLLLLLFVSRFDSLSFGEQKQKPNERVKKIRGGDHNQKQDTFCGFACLSLFLF